MDVPALVMHVNCLLNNCQELHIKERYIILEKKQTLLLGKCQVMLKGVCLVHEKFCFCFMSVLFLPERCAVSLHPAKTNTIQYVEDKYANLADFMIM